MWRVAVCGVLLVAVGCGGGGGSGAAGGRAGGGGNPGGTGGTVLCVPGASVACTCTSGASGAQICNMNGSGYGTCTCTGAGGASTGGPAATGGVGPGGAAGGVATGGGGGKAGAGGGMAGVGGGAAGAGGGMAGAGGAPVGGAGGTAPVTGSFTCADFQPSIGCAPFDTSKESSFANTTSGTTAIAYPLDTSLFPSNLGPIQVQLTTPGSAARITFRTTQTGDVNAQFYGSCETAPGTGCSVTIPLAFTQMLLPASQAEDIQLTARVLSTGGSPTADSAPISVAWASSPLTGGLYYWTELPNATACPSSSTVSPGSYCLPDVALVPKTGTAVYRYDFSQATLGPQQIWTDDGGPASSPPYQGAPQSWDSGMAGGHCIGCHAVSNDGKFMGLTVGGSSTATGANWALLDIQNQDLLLINPTMTGGNGCADTNASPTNDATCYWQRYRKDQFAIETAWGPDDTATVSMFKSKLYLNKLTISGATATLAQGGPALPSWTEYQSDPFWSHDGKSLVFTSFNMPATADTYGDPGGLNGDLKNGGQIAIAASDGTTIMDDARVLVGRVAGVSSFYPCVSEDGQFVIFDQSTCATNPDFNGSAAYGNGTCDGYDDSSAKLWWVPIGGGAAKRLDNANGGSSSNVDNSFPRFAPNVSTFRGQPLYWVVFSSRRPYGVQNNTAGLATSQAQLWFAGVTGGQGTAGDPSFAPVWLPAQNPMGNANAVGNHTPQWVATAVPRGAP